MSLKEMGFSLEQEIPVLEDELEEVKGELEEIKRRASNLRENEEDGSNTSQEFKRLKRRWSELQNEKSSLQSQINRFGEYVSEWESTRFVVRELTFGESQQIRDTVTSESFDVDVELQEIEGTPLQGLYQSQVLERSVVSMPDDAPSDPNDLPEILGDWLLEKCESVNSLGDEELGNMSLEEALDSES